MAAREAEQDVGGFSVGFVQYLSHAQRVRGKAQRSMAALMADWDILLAPATPVPATPIGQETLEIDGQARAWPRWCSQWLGRCGIGRLAAVSPRRAAN